MPLRYTGEHIESFNPANGELLAKVPSLGIVHLNEAITEAQKSFYDWRQVPAPKRAELVRLIGEELRKIKINWVASYLLRWVNLSRRVMVRFRR